MTVNLTYLGFGQIKQFEDVTSGSGKCMSCNDSKVRQKTVCVNVMLNELF